MGNNIQLTENIEIRDLGNLELLAKQVVEGFIIGLHKSPFHGFSVEFAEHRLYNQGESTKDIDWKVFARTNKMFVKRYEEETNLRCQLVLDTSSSMYFPEDAVVNKLSFSALAAASLMNLLRRQRDAFGLSLFDEQVHQHTRAKSSTTHYRLLLSYLQHLIDHPEHNRRTSVAESLHYIADSIHRRSLVVIFSDMFDRSTDRDAMFTALQHLKYNKHEVILFNVVDQSRELKFEFENRPHLFIDMETGEKVKLQPEQIKERYLAQVNQHQSDLKLRCMQYHIDLIQADISAGFKPVLQAALVKRAKMSR